MKKRTIEDIVRYDYDAIFTEEEKAELKAREKRDLRYIVGLFAIWVVAVILAIIYFPA